MLLARLDELGRGTWIALVVLSFWLWWPIGLALLGFIAFSRSRHGWGPEPGRWYPSTAGDASQRPAGPWGPGSGWGAGGGGGSDWRGNWRNGWGGCSRRRQSAPPSGNRAFDDYRTETLRRLEEEQREFVEYLERLRQARDKSEFDSFMAERRNRQAPQPPVENV